jgi:hypothetical protein
MKDDSAADRAPIPKAMRVKRIRMQACQIRLVFFDLVSINIGLSFAILKYFSIIT